MSQINFSMFFKQSEQIIVSFNKNINYYYDNDNDNDNNNYNICKCNELFVIEGLRTCKKCGMVYGSSFCEESKTSDEFNYFTHYKPYTRKKHIKEILTRLSSYFYKEKIEHDDIITLLKKNTKNNKDIKFIRKFIKMNKLNPKNDFYYWKIVNNITMNINYSDKNAFVAEFVKTRNMSNRDFLYKIFCENKTYNIFAPLFKRKIIKIEKIIKIKNPK